MKIKITKIIIGLLALAPLSATAFSWRDFWGDEDVKVEPPQTVVNEVNVSANSGGNTASGGEVKSGEAKASVKVKTEINGEILEDFDEEFSGDTDFDREFKHASGTASTTTNIRVKTNFPESDSGKSQVRPVNTVATTSVAPSIAATSTKASLRHFGDRLSDFMSKIFKNVFSIFKFK
ncbi:MAG: hypothetical protein A3D52_02815 [Candidatus Taylorbacteria bacterium RIFCSPHIGHO2_02_FULL_44_36]|uniref:Secreted protein n=1 Tax=Candidatus Taylorbacteria bacterium RIFCSPLOWO2_12_FULL_44_15c TaxID=1802333 RepID=A0A1G2P4A5_9BACT|nr:MAG: hypothetical protein A3D52_02815 [Candidatus Taylorbacteria bacterium RIFCSPHIGHO2_02_FULL_44_36]OHA43093.1 MAG: hypothetical protein A3G03_02260 [Candidatus Taylorbacteria bacterium RIFCSPLOWO2_12_FULL_44_15c]